MAKHLLGVCALLAVWAAATPALADINPEEFDPANGYLANTALSDFYWTENRDINGDTIDTTGVLDVVDIGGEHNLVAKMTANGPDPGPAFPAIAAQAGTTVGGDWGGPGRDVDTRLYFAVDVQKGVADASTSLSSFLWQLSFTRPNGNNILTLDGGLGTFRLKTASGNTAAFNLGQGWNQVAVLNDISGVNPNTVLYLNGIQIASINVTTGPLQSGTTSTGSVSLNRQSRGGTGDHFVGTIQFDNIITANEDILKFLTGDVSHDGIVDVSDIQVIAVNYLGPGPAGDANNDGIVDVSDIQVIAAHYLDGAGHSPYPGNGGGAGATAVPEPGTAVLMALGLVFGAARLYRRRAAK